MAEFILGSDKWPPMPEPLREFLRSAIPRLRADARLVGVTAGGSFVTVGLDEYSDLDLTVVSKPEVSGDVLRDGPEIAARLHPMLTAFRGDHVGEPRLLICLYGPPLIHVDLKFLSTEELALRVEDPAILWERDGGVSAGLARGDANYPQPDLQWMEDRFWAWVHYTVNKIARGELFEAIDALAFIRRRVHAPLILVDSGMRPDGVRRLEFAAPAFVAELKATIGAHERESCTKALEALITSYIRLREQHASPALVRRADAEREAVAFLRKALR